MLRSSNMSDDCGGGFASGKPRGEKKRSGVEETGDGGRWEEVCLFRPKTNTTMRDIVSIGGRRRGGEGETEREGNRCSTWGSGEGKLHEGGGCE